VLKRTSQYRKAFFPCKRIGRTYGI